VIPIRTAVEAADKMTRALVGAKRIVGRPGDRAGDPGPGRSRPSSRRTRVPLSDPRSGLHVTPGTMVGLVSGDPDESAAVALRLGRLVDDDQVTLGGTRLADLPMATVRRRVLVSEAEPRLFTGGLREELDPWSGTVDDAALFAALEVASAGDVLEALPEGLDAQVDEAGRGFLRRTARATRPGPSSARRQRRPRARRADQLGRRAHRGDHRGAAAGRPARRRPHQ
jgi:hypothetical protein